MVLDVSDIVANEVQWKCWHTLFRNKKIRLEITDEKTAKMILLLMDKLEEHDDVQNVYSNFDIPDEVMEKVQI